MAADQGHANAQYQAGFYYAQPGRVQDHIEAARYYLLAANQGCAPAQTNLGFCYSQGVGVVQNSKKGCDFTG